MWLEGEVKGGGGGGDYNLMSHCHHQNDFCISEESRFNVSLIVTGSVTRQSLNHNI